jgi:hypothetical protein
MPLDWNLIPASEIPFAPYPSRRSVVFGTKGIVAAVGHLALSPGFLPFTNLDSDRICSVSNRCRPSRIRDLEQGWERRYVASMLRLASIRDLVLTVCAGPRSRCRRCRRRCFERYRGSLRTGSLSVLSASLRPR